MQVDVTPARIDQIRRGSQGRMLAIDADVGGVAEDLRRIDPGLKVRFAADGAPPYWVVSHVKHDGCPRNGDCDEYLITTVAAVQSKLGIWTGLDKSLVHKFERLAAESYDFAAEVERMNLEAHERQRKERLTQLEERAELAAWAARKDLGRPYKGRVFVPDDIPA